MSRQISEGSCRRRTDGLDPDPDLDLSMYGADASPPASQPCSPLRIGGSRAWYLASGLARTTIQLSNAMKSLVDSLATQKHGWLASSHHWRSSTCKWAGEALRDITGMVS